MAELQNTEEHIQRHVEQYEVDRTKYEKFAEKIRDLIADYIGSGIIHKTEFRAKSVESFKKKVGKLNDDGTLRYTNPIEEITDLAGVRVIVLLRDNVDLVCSKIAEILEVIEKEDVGDRVFKKGKFGYQSNHLLVRLNKDRRDLYENKFYLNFICEVQVRTLLQHVWAEIEHDIQYKGDSKLPIDLSKRFSALAGLLDIADRELANIQKESNEFKKSIKEDLVSDLTQENLSIEQSIPGHLSESHYALYARDLVNSGAYSEAISLYSTKIEQEPGSFTLYIGRARAKYLDGDYEGALQDLETADEISKSTHKTERLRRIILQGENLEKKRISSKVEDDLLDEKRQALEALRNGNGALAFSIYNTLEAKGFNRAFALIGKAFSCVLERDLSGAKSFSGLLEIRQGTPMAINLCALTAVLSLLSGSDLGTELKQLDQRLAEVPQFNLDISPLNDFRQGLNIKYPDQQQSLKTIFDRMSQNIR